MPPDEPNEEERLEQLPQDYETPFQPPDSNEARDNLDDTHPATDTNIQQEEVYDEGVSGAAETTDSGTDSGVADYNDERDNAL